MNAITQITKIRRNAIPGDDVSLIGAAMADVQYKDVPRIPILLYDRSILDYFGNPGITCPMRRRRIEEADIGMTIIFKFLEFRGGVVRNKKEVDLAV